MRIPKPALAGALLLAVGACSTAAQQAKQMAPNEVVASVGATKVTLGEVDELALQESSASFGGVRLVQAIYLARRAALEEIVGNRLIDQEAKARGVDRAAIVAQEITAHASAPTPAEVEQWYQANPDATQGRPLEQLREPIVQLLTQQRTVAAHDDFVEKLKAKTPVQILLDPPRQQVASAGHPGKGPEKAPIEMIEFSDFQCPFCQRANPTVAQVLATYGDRIHFVYRHYPLPNHPNARPAAEAAACANEQGHFWEYHDQLFSHSTQLSDADLKAHAAAIRLDTTRFNACVDGHSRKAEVDQDIKDGEAVGVNGTPAFFINGRSLEGAQPFEAFTRLIDEELAAKAR